MTVETWQTRAPDFVADVRLYSVEDGGKSTAALLGWGCPCFVSKYTTRDGWDARLQLGNLPFEPGTERRVGFVFLSSKGAEAIKSHGHFYLWEGRFIGEASVVD